MEKLGEPFGLRKGAVHNCIHDETALVLRIYWETAENVDLVLKWFDLRQRQQVSE